MVVTREENLGEEEEGWLLRDLIVASCRSFGFFNTVLLTLFGFI